MNKKNAKLLRVLNVSAFYVVGLLTVNMTIQAMIHDISLKLVVANALLGVVAFYIALVNLLKILEVFN